MKMRRRPLRRRFSLFRLVSRLIILLAALWSCGFAIFLVAVLTAAPPNPMPHADGIIALTGGDDRVSTALALLAEHDAPLLLISGAGHGTYLGDFTIDNAPAATSYASEITLGHMADTTHGNALEAADWVRAHAIHTLIIVTADYHMPRALAELQSTLPGITLIAAPVRPPAMRALLTWPTLRLLAGEYTKFLVVRAGLGDAAATLTDPEK
jgi:uncharacterized SAM-binding protein YcdF (DUF218 family)